MSRKSQSSSEGLPLDEMKDKPKLYMPLLGGPSDSNSSDYGSNPSNPTGSSQQGSKLDQKTPTGDQDQNPEQPLNIIPYPDMYHYLTKNTLGFTYKDILKHDEKKTILGDLFEIFKQEIYQENIEQKSRCSPVKNFCYPRMKWSWNETTASDIKANALSSSTGTIGRMSIVGMTSKEGETTTDGMKMKEVIANGVTAKEVRLAGGGFIAKDLNAEQMPVLWLT